MISVPGVSLYDWSLLSGIQMHPLLSLFSFWPVRVLKRSIPM
jgi:hypothetical protein